jgi:signal transduction histidine kinase
MKAWWERLSLRLKLAFVSAAAAIMPPLAAGALVLAGTWKPSNPADFFTGLAVIGPVGALASAALAYAVAGWALTPLKATAARLQQFRAGGSKEPLPAANSPDELGLVAAAANESLRQLQEAFAQLDRMTADVSHELRTPLTAMRAVGEVALRESNPAILHDAVGSMLEEIRKMNQLIERLLLLTRPSADEMPLKLEAGVLRPLLLEVSDSLCLVAEEKHQSLTVDCPEHLLAVFDPALLRLALMNLAQNAMRYSPPGKPIRIAASMDGEEVAVEVTDEGPGIAPEHQTKIFERFYRVDKARSRADGGVGLGLAIVKWAVERMGGSIALQSQPGRGSTFRLRLRSVSGSVKRSHHHKRT